MKQVLTIQLDRAGWEPIPSATLTGAPTWHNVAKDIMRVIVGELPPAFPALDDLEAVRRYMRQRINGMGGAVISCDVVEVVGQRAIRSIWKHRSNRGKALSFSARITLPHERSLIEVTITGTEPPLTGVREVLIFQGLMASATPAQAAILSAGGIPPEWRFERYEPDTRPGFAYLVSDAEEYDERVPQHPLSRVRRLLRRQEKHFSVSLTEVADLIPVAAEDVPSAWQRFRNRFSAPPPASLNLSPPLRTLEIAISQPEVKPLGYDEMMSELGVEIVTDIFAVAIFADMKQPALPMDVRQKSCEERMVAELQQLLEHQNRLQKIRRQALEDVHRLSPSETKVYLLSMDGALSWMARNDGGDQNAVLVFTSAAFADDFIAGTDCNASAVAMSVTELFALLPDLRSRGIDKLLWNACPRCPNVKLKQPLSDATTEAELLKHVAVSAAVELEFVTRDLKIAEQETDPLKKKMILQNLLDHIDPGAPAVAVSLGRLAQEQGDRATYADCVRRLKKYAPIRLDELSGGSSGTSTLQ